ncbi:MAG: hypothetical protein QXN22_07975 [Thermofilaceae archaeon]
MGENDPQYVTLGYYEDLESKLLKHSTVLLIGPRFSGKTTGVEFISRKLRLGPIKHLQMEKLEQRNLQEVRELSEAAEKRGEASEAARRAAVIVFLYPFGERLSNTPALPLWGRGMCASSCRRASGYWSSTPPVSTPTRTF